MTKNREHSCLYSSLFCVLLRSRQRKKKVSRTEVPWAKICSRCTSIVRESQRLPLQRYRSDSQPHTRVQSDVERDGTQKTVAGGQRRYTPRKQRVLTAISPLPCNQASCLPPPTTTIFRAGSIFCVPDGDLLVRSTG